MGTWREGRTDKFGAGGPGPCSLCRSIPSMMQQPGAAGCLHVYYEKHRGLGWSVTPGLGGGS